MKELYYILYFFFYPKTEIRVPNKSGNDAHLRKFLFQSKNYFCTNATKSLVGPHTVFLEVNGRQQKSCNTKGCLENYFFFSFLFFTSLPLYTTFPY